MCKLGLITLKTANQSQKLNLIKITMMQRTDIFGDMHMHFRSRQTLQSTLLQHSSVICGTTTVLPGYFGQIRKKPILIVEEAARMAEYNLALFWQLNPLKVILIGDVM